MHLHKRPVPSSSQSWWLDTIGRIPLLTPAEEIELGTAIQRWQNHPDPCPPGIRRRGQRARDRFVQANLRLVIAYISKRCHRLAKVYDREDLTQAGNMGLITAVERFDPARGYRFSTYAYWWIRQAVNQWVDRNGRSIAIPGSHCQHLSRLAGITRRLERELNRAPTQAELAAELGVSLKVLEAVIENGRSVGSLDQVVTDDGLELSSTVATYDRSPEDEEEQRERWRQAEQLRGLIARLAPQDQRLLSLAWGLDGVEIPRAELAQQEGLSTRALDVRLERLQASLASQSVQLVLVAVARANVEPIKRTRRKRERPDQLVLLKAARAQARAVAVVPRIGGTTPRNWIGLSERLRLAVSGGSW
jgi:RNA polymerase primary sigma factor